MLQCRFEMHQSIELFVTPKCLLCQRKTAILDPNRSIIVRLPVYGKGVSSSGPWKLHFQGLFKFFFSSAQPTLHFIFWDMRFGEHVA